MKKFKVYFLVLITITLSSCNDNYPKVGHYKLIQGPGSGACLVDTLENKNGVLIIDEHILYYGYNSEYILINQKPEDSLRDQLNGNLAARKEIIYANTFSQYYIFNLKDGVRYGPFDKQEYLNTKDSLGISRAMKMNYSTLGFYMKGQRNDINYKYPDEDIVDLKNLKENSLSSIW